MNFKGVLIFISLLFLLAFFFKKGMWVIVIVLILKLPTSLKRSRYYLLILEEYKNHLRIVYMDYGKLRTRLIEKSELSIAILQFQSRDTGYYLSISEKKNKVLMVSDSAGWTLVDFLIIKKRIDGVLPKNWYLKEKYVIEYMRTRYPNVIFSWDELVGDSV